MPLITRRWHFTWICSSSWVKVLGLAICDLEHKNIICLTLLSIPGRFAKIVASGHAVIALVDFVKLLVDHIERQSDFGLLNLVPGAELLGGRTALPLVRVGGVLMGDRHLGHFLTFGDGLLVGQRAHLLDDEHGAVGGVFSVIHHFCGHARVAHVAELFGLERLMELDGGLLKLVRKLCERVAAHSRAEKLGV